MSAEVTSVVEHLIDISGRRVRVRVHGEGQPVLLINGLGANVTMWAPLLERLEGFQVITFDAPGTGRSEAPRLPYRLSGVASVASRVLDALGHEQVDVLGYSLGGAVAQQLAFQDPQRVRRLVLVSTSSGAGAVPGSLRALMAVMTPARHYAKSGYGVAMKMINLAPAEKESDFLRQQAGNWHHEAPPSMRGYALQMTAFSLFNSLPWLHRVTQPTLVLSGTDDRLIPLANGAVLAAYLPNARLRSVERWGHYLLHDAASGAGEAIAEFLGAGTLEESSSWNDATVVSAEEMAAFVHGAPRSAHPYQYVNWLVRRWYPVRKAGR